MLVTPDPYFRFDFVDATPQDAEYLTQFALDSNAIYKSRTVSDAEARHVLELTEKDIATGVVQILTFYDRVIGFYSLRWHKNARGKSVNELGHLFISPDSLGQGFGSLLFLQAMKMAKKEMGWSTIEWNSDPHAAGFYRKMGAKQIGSNCCRLNPACEVPIFAYSL